MNCFTCSNEAYEEMTKEARRAYPKECCGILFGREREIRYAFPVQNVVSAQNSRRHFEMDPLIVYQAECEAEKRGMEMLGIYHSHPDSPPIPSSEDLAYMIPGISYWILSVEQGIEKELRGYAKEPDPKKPVPIRIEKGAAASCRF
ncbi:MAG: M67 family metallopeptidase [Lachnospiraceae bacterium]|nr:M67 family metallopeptidase [Lachnospiraceae bacterium]